MAASSLTGSLKVPEKVPGASAVLLSVAVLPFEALAKIRSPGSNT